MLNRFFNQDEEMMSNDYIYEYEIDDDNEPYSFYEAECAACECYAPLGDMMLCEECTEKLERDLMRQREWTHSATAFTLTLEGREEVRRQIIQEYGGKLELLTASSTGNKMGKSQE